MKTTKPTPNPAPQKDSSAFEFALQALRGVKASTPELARKQANLLRILSEKQADKSSSAGGAKS